MSKRCKGLTIIEGIVFLAVVLVVATVAYPIFQKRTIDNRRPACLSNLKQMILASLIYSDDYDDRFEKDDRWMDALSSYTKNENVFHDKSGVPDGGYGYAFRGSASRVLIADIADPDNFIVLFDSSLNGRSAHSELWSIPQPGRHMSADNVGFADGHVKGLSTGDVDKGIENTLQPALLADDQAGPLPPKASEREEPLRWSAGP